VSRQRMGHAIATFFTCFDLGLAFGSVIMGLLIAYTGYSLTYMACALIVILTLWVYRSTLGKAKQ
jgi:predicted MFS family arabinose efflux permease